MKKLLIAIAIIVSLGLGIGGGYAAHKTPQPQGEPALGGLYQTNTSQFSSGLTAGSTGQLAVDSSGNATTTAALAASAIAITGRATSSSSPAALGSAVAGKLVIPASATSVGASTTAVTANSLVLYSQSATTTIAGTTCNSNIASGTITSSIIPGNGFVLRTQIAPATNPFCYDFWVIKP